MKPNLGIGKANKPKKVSVKKVTKVSKGRKMSLSSYHSTRGKV